MSEAVSPLNVKLPAQLRERARAVAKHRHTTTTALIIEALTALVEAHEAKERAERDLRRREEDERRERRRRSLFLADPASLAPKSSADESATPQSPREDADAAIHEEDRDVLEPPHPLYLEYAEKIRRTTDPTDRRLIVMDACRAVREQYPLTAPIDHVIRRRLETLVVILNRNGDATVLAATDVAEEKPQNFLERVLGGLNPLAGGGGK